MFIVNEKLKGLPKNYGTFQGVLHSINEPMIAAADHPAEATQAFICTLSLPDDRIEAHIILFLKQSGLRVMYSWDEGPMNSDLKEEMEAEALDFVESMGFMMDNLNLDKLSTSQREQSLNELPIFGEMGPEPSIQELVPEVEDLDELVAIEEESEPTTNVRPQPMPPVPSLASAREADPLEMLEAEFGRPDGDFGEPIDAALEALMATSPKPKRPAQESPVSPGVEPAQAPARLGSEALLRLMAGF